SVSYGGPNTISIAAAAMVSTFFDVREQPALNFGVLGSIVTRQLMRAFHHENRRYDEQGYRFRWNESEEIKFMDRWNCRQNLRPGLPYDDAEPTVSIGAHALFRAYKKAAAGRFDVASGGLNSDQLFFVSRCYVYCGYRHIDTPHECAVLAQDSPEFARAFNCPKGSPMNPENKCDLW
ncbi:neprilysin, putative, partial [Ixodes scapularis]